MGKDPNEYITTGWSNGTWAVSWIAVGRIFIVGPGAQRCVMDDGDFEGVLAALCCAAFNAISWGSLNLYSVAISGSSL